MYKAKTDILKGDTNNSTIIVWDFNALLSLMDRTSRQKTNKKIEEYKQHYKSTRPSRHLPNIPPNRICMFSWTILQDRP